MNFLELRLTQAMNVVPHCAVGSVTLPRTGHCHAIGGVGTLIFGFWKLPAKSASHIDDKVLLGSEVLILCTKGHRINQSQYNSLLNVNKTTYATKFLNYFIIIRT